MGLENLPLPTPPTGVRTPDCPAVAFRYAEFAIPTTKIKIMCIWVQNFKLENQLLIGRLNRGELTEGGCDENCVSDFIRKV
jgi:hypothetical protein